MRKSPYKRWATIARGVALISTLVLACGSATARPDAAGSQRERIYEAATRTYIHGMTDEIAHAEFGMRSVPILLELLEDPDFPRRDNVVAVLGYLGHAETTAGVLRFLRRPPASPEVPEEDRALLLAPQTLGRIASRGEPDALEALLEMTAPGSNGGILALAASRSSSPSAMRDDLLQMGLNGLARSGAAEARGRLDAIAQGHSRPAPSGRDLRQLAERALQRFDRSAVRSSATGSARVTDGGRRATAARSSIDDFGAETQTALDGIHFKVNNSKLDFANHVNLTNPMTMERLDECLDHVSRSMGKVDFGSDVACCAGVQRSGAAPRFGIPLDGLDIIDDYDELLTVLNNSTARFKVVRMINNCGDDGSNIIGCGWIGGDGAAVVRYGDTGIEGALWAHEYGHNAGLSHSTNGSDYIMSGYLTSRSKGLTQAECDVYHAPASKANAVLVSAGACADGDNDDVHDVVDNCADTPNTDQRDSDADGVGDVCEGGCGDGVVDGDDACDGDDLNGASCGDLGYDSGALACTEDCTFDETACAVCGDGVRQGDEACDGADMSGAACGDEGCTGGEPSCNEDCTIDWSGCAGCQDCDNDGICEDGENCENCPDDCATGEKASCGNGVCEPLAGEDCASCPRDCAGNLRGRLARRFCCGDGDGFRPVGCDDRRCTSRGRSCSDELAVASCCGDLYCDGGENGFTCELDCGAPPECGDGVCDDAEDPCSCEADCGLPPLSERYCGDGVDDDCDGLADCSDKADCGEDPACAKTCEPFATRCEADSDCCSARCSGWPGWKVCL